VSLEGVPVLSELRYAELSAGDRLGSFVEELAPVSDQLRGAIGVVAEGEHAPGGVLPLVTLRVLRRALRGIPPGGVLVRQRFTVHAPLPAGASVRVAVRVSAQREAHNGLQTTFTFAVHQADDLAAVVEWTILAAPE
jgi:acyl dehydratase